jgi:hypothetical protein
MSLRHVTFALEGRSAQLLRARPTTSRGFAQDQLVASAMMRRTRLYTLLTPAAVSAPESSTPWRRNLPRV